jgi:NhaA family Na+:H+ antiporter
MKFLDRPLDAPLQTLIERKVVRLFSPLERFIRKQAAASLLSLMAITLALGLANSPWHGAIPALASVKLGISLYRWEFEFSVSTLINDGLLSLFFLLLGLEIKREIMNGHLRHPRKVALILLAALGGMVVPALIYLAFNHGGAGQAGWAVPMTTDTAFAIGVLAVLAHRVSIGVSIFLAALAIFDDIGSIAVIAAFYAQDIDVDALLYALVAFALLCGANLTGFRKSWMYIVPGVVLWFFVHASGLHSTLAGLLVALAIPARSRISQRSFIARIRKQILAFEKNDAVDSGILKSQEQHRQMSDMGETVRSASTPLQQWDSILVNPIAIVVLPVFALFNAGIHLSADAARQALSSPVTWGVVAGLTVGKPLGIMLFSLVAVRTRLGRMPEGMGFRELAGVGMLAGVGFTMSLFIAGLGFENQPALRNDAQIGILAASLLSALLGAGWILGFARKKDSASWGNGHVAALRRLLSKNPVFTQG